MNCKVKLPKVIEKDSFNDVKISDRPYEFVESYLNSIYDLILDSLNDFSRVTAFRFDLRFPKDYKVESDVNYMRLFWSSVKSKIEAEIKRRNNSVSREKPRYAWCKEIKNAKNHHYHLLLLVNKNNFRSIGDYTRKKPFNGGCKHIYQMLVEAWSSALKIDIKDAHNLVFIPDNCTYHIHRGKSESDLNNALCNEGFNELFRRVSYLAKLKSKKYGDGQRSFGSSRRS
ncbi:inovirus Gp2 family protein [Vibrio sp. 1F255]|uniref:inovirus Gp2 family protein n=1 Tax=Vibrio sp. 1F255 TaxID=3230009 RepID=UPI00352BF87D